MEFSLRNKSFFIDGAKFLSIIWSVLFFFQSNSIYYVAYESNFKKYIYALSVVLSIGSLFLILLYSAEKNNLNILLMCMNIGIC